MVPAPFVSRMVQSQIGTPVASFNKVISNGAATVLYPFSKRTDIYAGVETGQLTGESRGNSVFIGLRHRF